MKKTLLVLLMAGLLLISATACSGDGKNNTGTGTETETTEKNPGNDPLGKDTETETTAKETETTPDITEDPADFNEASLEVIVLVNKATLRKAPSSTDETSYVTTVKKDFVMTVTGESNNWYRVTLDDYDFPCYIAKSVARDKAVLDAFVDGNPVNVIMSGVSEGDEAEVVNVRTYPSSDSTLNDGVKVGTIAEGTVVVRLSESNGWSKILFQSKEDTEAKTYYVSSDFFTVVEDTNSNTPNDNEPSAQA